MNTLKNNMPGIPPIVTPMPIIQMAAQSTAVQPERFQTDLISGMTRALLRTPSPPCLLRAPTGSGKTFVISQVLERVSEERNVLWFWFVPFVTLVQQTEDALRANSPSLAPCGLNAGRNQEAHGGMVLLSTAQGVARAQSRTKGYDADGDDDTRTLAAFLARARVQGLQIGLVVDEAHIALDKGTEFGKFAHWLKADYLVMATATPKDERLNEFLTNAGYNAQVSFAVSRDEVVKARLNKKYIEAVVYSLGNTMAHITDLRRTVLRQSWRRNLKIKRDLVTAGINLTPLLLVQVANGDKTVDEAADDLMRLCGVPPEAIGRHSSDEPDPVLMASIANDSSKQVLIFKQSAGTGFDAPRAFVLASTKPVNDADFAMQFIGRVMRVARPVRDAFSKPKDIPADLNTAYVYLGNAQAQAGFESAVKASTEVKDQLEGQTEKLETRQTVSGAVVYSNRPTDQEPVAFDMQEPDRLEVTLKTLAEVAVIAIEPQASLFVEAHTVPYDMSGGLNGALDEVVPASTANPRMRRTDPKTREELMAELDRRGLRAYPLKHNLAKLERSLKTEEKPELDDMSEISRAVASRLVISEGLRATAVKAALNRIKEIERHTELTTGEGYTEEIQVFTDRSALAREAMAALRALPQAEEEDYKLIVQVLASRLRRSVDDEIENLPIETQPTEAERARLARDAAHWVVRRSSQELREAIFSEIAARAKMVDAKPLPDMMIFPRKIALELSAKNIYGVLPPSREDGEKVSTVMMVDDRMWLADKTYAFEGVEFSQGQYDGTWFGNNLENAFSRALDRTDYVVWWHRNPRNKPYAVRVVRAEHDNYFYPDFVVCIRHNPADEPLLRLLETKDDTKNASGKSKHSPASYGKVLFLTPDGNRMRWVNDDGSMGAVVDFDDMQSALEMLAATRPGVVIKI
ncbi:DEAD/DEAH box helicase [Polaromonas glacialis]|uniref:DEAD/DEAH box helicase n=1 Tax=Polaromonas glacialis TaxID=866564 RepID=UPI00068E5A75|nr:DEAD/DEAH box helicase family protein [Polaromonas glacialis]